MHYSLVFAAFAAAVQAIPAGQLVEREARVYTVTEVVNVWTTVTVYDAAPTQKGFRWRWGNRKSSSAPAVPTIVTPQPSSQAPQQPAQESPAPVPQQPASQQPAASSAPVPQAPVSNAPDTGNTGNSGNTDDTGNSGNTDNGSTGGSNSPTTPTTPPAPTTPSVPASDGYSDQVLYHHNVHRSNHSAPDLVWDPAIAATAQKIAETCSYGHSMDIDGGNYGQNIAAGAPVNAISRVISDQFYNGEVNLFTKYGEPTPSDFDANFKQYGHFTQVVWVGTTRVGCATVDCSKVGLKNVGSRVPPIYHVCNYKPAGNFMGRFDTNVLRSQNLPTVRG